MGTGKIRHRSYAKFVPKDVKLVNQTLIVFNVLTIIIWTLQSHYVSVVIQTVSRVLVLHKTNVQVVINLYTLNQTNVITLPVHMVSM